MTVWCRPFRAACARERVTRDDPREHPLLLGVGVEQERVGGGGALVGVGHVRNRAPEREPLALRGNAEQRVDDGMLETVGVARHARADIRERRDDEPRTHRERGDVRREGTELVDDRLRLEDAVLVGEGREGRTVEVDAEVGSERAHELEVDGEGAVQLELEVVWRRRIASERRSTGAVGARPPMRHEAMPTAR